MEIQTKEHYSDFRFFISTSYSFENNLWNSGGFKINQNRWAKNDQNEPLYPMLNDRLIFIRNFLWRPPVAWGKANCNDDNNSNDHRSFKMRTVSSNGYDFNVTNRHVYCICRIKSGLKFERMTNLKSCYHKCEDPWVPRNENDFESILENSDFYTDTNHDTNSDFWTDYERVNETHFWSDIAKTWWSQCRSSGLGNLDDSKFMSSVIIDSNGEIRNMANWQSSGCICVGKVKFFLQAN